MKSAGHQQALFFCGFFWRDGAAFELFQCGGSLPRPVLQFESCLPAREALSTFARGSSRPSVNSRHRARCSLRPGPPLNVLRHLPPRAASEMFRDISLVVADCSSTALAMVREMSFTCPITSRMDLIAVTAPLASDWMASIFGLMFAVAVCFASSCTSFAPTANPAPTSPARAASTVAFNASRSVFWASR